MEPRILILETSGPGGFAALASGPVLRQVRRLDESRRHARDLAPAVAELLKAAGWTPRQVEAVVVSRGPGSYTGLRVGIVSAKAFAYATGCALIAVDTFATIALQAPREATQLDVLADAQQDKIYVQRFDRPSAGAALEPASALAIRTFSEWLPGVDSSGWISGPGLRRFRDRLPEGYRLVEAEFWDPRPESLLQLGLDRYQAGARDGIWILEPIYLRPSAAEEKWREK